MYNIGEVNKRFLVGKTVLVRVDWNVPLENFMDHPRVYSSFETIDYLLSSGSKVIIMTHRGRPNGVEAEEMSTRAVLPYIIERYPDIEFLEHGSAVKRIALLENLRFSEGEESNDTAFARGLAKMADMYVNDAFSVSHREHASICAITEYLPSMCGLGFMREMRSIYDFLHGQYHTKMCIIGGNKLSSKMYLIKKLMVTMDKMVLGGAMIIPFLKDTAIANDEVSEIIACSKQYNCELIFPEDFIALLNDVDLTCMNVEHILDIGLESTQTIIDHMQTADALLWNGPLGKFEVAPFSHSTRAIVREISALTKAGRLKSLVGGGNTVVAFNEYDGEATYLSNSGGAFLEFIEQETLPGIVALKRGVVPLCQYEQPCGMVM